LYGVMVRLGDTIDTLDPVTGRIGDRSYAFSQQAVNSAWRKMQSCLAAMGHWRLRNDAVIPAIPALGSTDPANRLTLTWNGGTGPGGTFTTPALPQDLMTPLIVQERISGNTPPSSFRTMDEIPRDGSMPLVTKQSYQIYWQWHSDVLYLAGSLVLTDLYIRYASFLSDFTDFTAINALAQTVPILRSFDPFCNFICAELVSAIAQEKGDGDLMQAAIGYEQKATQGCRDMLAAGGIQMMKDTPTV
jgi:hypothetical protein